MIKNRTKEAGKMEIEGLENLAGTDLIQDTFLFQLLNFNETMALAGLCRRERRKNGEIIIEENSLGEALYLVENGRVRVLKGEGKEQEELAVLGRGELFGEMSLIEDELTSASVAADGDVELLVIKRAEFEELLAKDQTLALKVYKAFCNTLSERLRRTSEELTQLKARLSRTSAPPPKTAPTKVKPKAAASRKSSKKK